MTHNPSLRKVYVVTLDEGGDLRGVYSSREKAMAWIDRQPKRTVRWKPYEVTDYSVEEWTLDE